jgi:hypothetical protein
MVGGVASGAVLLTEGVPLVEGGAARAYCTACWMSACTSAEAGGLGCLCLVIRRWRAVSSMSRKVSSNAIVPT